MCVLNPAISKIKTEDNTSIHLSDKKVELACDRPWLPALEPAEASRAPGYTVHVTQGLVKKNHMRSVVDLVLTFQLHSLRMSTGAQQEKSANSQLLCDVSKVQGYHSRRIAENAGH